MSRFKTNRFVQIGDGRSGRPRIRTGISEVNRPIIESIREKESERIASLVHPVAKYEVYWTHRSFFTHSTETKVFWDENAAKRFAAEVNEPLSVTDNTHVKEDTSATVLMIPISKAEADPSAKAWPKNRPLKRTVL